MIDERDADSRALARFVQQHAPIFVLTGAGVSTESGIPGYRDRDGQWARSAPIRIDEFLRSDGGRRRYWYRSMRGWPRIAQAQPNAAHDALARLEATGRIARLVTQNVDGLHQRAGSRGPIELHGNLHRVRCLACGAIHSRAAVQQTLERQNARFLGASDSIPAPDGDATSLDEPDAQALESFATPVCDSCNGSLRPDIVFFGESVPAERVDAARAMLESADAMLVVGSSLMVYSGYRFCEWAAKQNKPIAAVNIGRTRADSWLMLKIERRCGEALTRLVSDLTKDEETLA